MGTDNLPSVQRRRGVKVRLEFRSSHHIKGEERFERERGEEKGRQLKVALKANNGGAPRRQSRLRRLEIEV